MIQILILYRIIYGSIPAFGGSFGIVDLTTPTVIDPQFIRFERDLPTLGTCGLPSPLGVKALGINEVEALFDADRTDGGVSTASG